MCSIDTIEEFVALKDEWDELLDSSNQANPYLSQEWLEAWWTLYAGPRDRLAVLICRDDHGGRILGALPAYVRAEGGLLSSRSVRLIADEHVGSMGLGCIADRAAEEEVFEAVCEHLVTSISWDALRFHNAVPCGTFAAALMLRAATEGAKTRLGPPTPCPSVALSSDWETYLRTLSRHWRSQVRRQRRQLATVGDVEVERIARSEDLDGALADAVRLFEHSMSRRFGTPYTISDRYRRFIETAATGFLKRGCLRLVFLRIDGQRAAFICQFNAGDTMLAYQTGFDEAWAARHVGMVLFGYAIEGAIAEGCARYDFGPGAEPYKMRWGGTYVNETADVCLYAKSVGGVSRATGDAAVRAAKDVIKKASPAQFEVWLSHIAGRRRLERL